jgi:hypothetical protein
MRAGRGDERSEPRTSPIFANLRSVVERILGSFPIIAPNSRLFRIKTLRSALELVCTRIGISCLDYIRCTLFITNALKCAVTPNTIAGWVEHSDGGILVAKTYGHLRKKFSEEAAKRICPARERVVVGEAKKQSAPKA